MSAPTKAAAVEASAVAPSWSELLAACDDYARQAGWRYVEHDFMKLNASDGRAAARAAALPTALEFGDRLRALRRPDATLDDNSPLVQEFRGCQRVVAASAVHNTLLATVRALGLWPTDAPPQLFDTAWQDCEGADAPTIARRLRNYEATFDANPAAQAQRRERERREHDKKERAQRRRLEFQALELARAQEEAAAAAAGRAKGCLLYTSPSPRDS